MPRPKCNTPAYYLGVIEKIPYLKSLGVTAIEFLPVHHCHSEDLLQKKGLTNYWGYNTLGFFAPDSRFSTGRYPGCQVQEFKQMVKELHKVGLEVILDVVYNHTCEGDERSPPFLSAVLITLPITSWVRIKDITGILAAAATPSILTTFRWCNW
ncbi:MAG: alpha-amylase family glycosyl hydrolase [Candidatus Syntrophopropionicum ammoniitolerans]